MPPVPSLAAWLLDARRPLPRPELLEAANLAGYAFTVLPADHPDRNGLRPAYLRALARHQAIKAELVPLVRAWNAAGIEPLLFKGFYLAEFVYPAPGMRFHGDVDVLVPPEAVVGASDVAQRLGWTERFNTIRAGAPWAHYLCALDGPSGATRVDLHRWILHSPTPRNQVQRRVTAAVWQASERRTWEGARVRVPAPVDALLVALILQRCWGDRWRLKVHDALDFRFLCGTLGIGREQLWLRARELRAERTLALWLERCDPARDLLDLRPPHPRDVRRWNRRSVGDRGLVATYAPAVYRAARIPRALLAIAWAMPSLLAAHRALGRHGDMTALLRSLPPRRRRPAPSARRRDFVLAGILRGVRAFPRNRRGDCVLRSLAICHLLWREGCEARFVSGVRRAGGRLEGHAWVELDGRPLDALAEISPRSRYAVNVEFPQPAPAEAVGSAAGRP